ncbi:MAG: hypothetical protein ABWY45_13515 [Mycobacterium sp.]
MTGYRYVLGSGAPDIVVHVAGGSSATASGFVTLDEDTWLRELNLNLLGAVRLGGALVPAMICRRVGVDRAHRFHPEPDAALRRHTGVCGGHGRTSDLQQGSVE